MLSREPHAGLDVSLDAYLANGSNYETVRLIALSDSVLGRGRELRRPLRLGARGDSRAPGDYFRGVADTFWEFLRRSRCARTSRRASRRPPRRLRRPSSRDGDRAPEPAGHVLVEGVPYGFVWCASDYIDSCTLADPAQVWRPERAASAIGRSSRRSGRGTPSFPRGKASMLRHRAPQPHHPSLPDAAALARRRHRRARLAASARLAHDRRSSGPAAFLVLLIHAASQGVAPEFALPLYPVFIVTALGALAGDRGPSHGQLASTG